MDILNGDGFYGHYIFYRLLAIDLHELSHYYHFKVLMYFRFLRFLPLHEVCCMYHVLCIEYYTSPEWRNKDVQSRLYGQRLCWKKFFLNVKLVLDLLFLHVYVLMMISWHGSVFHVWPFFEKNPPLTYGITSQKAEF